MFPRHPLTINHSYMKMTPLILMFYQENSVFNIYVPYVYERYSVAVSNSSLRLVAGIEMTSIPVNHINRVSLILILSWNSSL